MISKIYDKLKNFIKENYKQLLFIIMSTIYESEEYIELTKQLETLISEETIIHKKINVLMDKMQSLVSQYEKEKDTVDTIIEQKETTEEKKPRRRTTRKKETN